VQKTHSGTLGLHFHALRYRNNGVLNISTEKTDLPLIFEGVRSATFKEISSAEAGYKRLDDFSSRHCADWPDSLVWNLEDGLVAPMWPNNLLRVNLSPFGPRFWMLRDYWVWKRIVGKRNDEWLPVRIGKQDCYFSLIYYSPESRRLKHRLIDATNDVLHITEIRRLSQIDYREAIRVFREDKEDPSTTSRSQPIWDIMEGVMNPKELKLFGECIRYRGA
jgi:hypothetical protein